MNSATDKDERKREVGSPHQSSNLGLMLIGKVQSSCAERFPYVYFCQLEFIYANHLNRT